ncbi:hypothetical protein AB0D59_24295 [Streptomyces sp. NPDC048417]|uniref:hypothetical protein n=1 Tax=Streptomyces sp. NPDC048417 TaxID=3155387 RepID=UPI00343E2C43
MTEQHPHVDDLADLLAELARALPEPGSEATALHIGIRSPSYQEGTRRVELPAEAGRWIAETLRRELATHDSSQPDGDGRCRHCRGTGRTHTVTASRQP